MRSTTQFISILLIVCVAACSSPEETGTASAATAVTSAEPIEFDVRGIHAAYLKTLVEEGPTVALERYYADEYTYLGVDGKIIDKAGLKTRMQRNELEHFTMEDDLRRVSVYGDTAVPSGHSTSSHRSRPGEGDARWIYGGLGA